MLIKLLRYINFINEGLYDTIKITRNVNLRRSL